MIRPGSISRWLASRPPARLRCEQDDWSFDPRYTNGRCPICGWTLEGAPTAPGWLAAVNRVDWQTVMLVGLVDLLVLLSLIVSRAAGLFSLW